MIGRSELPGDLREEEYRILERVQKGERVQRYETVRFAKDGRKLHIALSAAPMHDHTGRIVGVAKVARDITEPKQAEAKLRQSEEMLREADRRKDEFLAILAHELRNPLAPLVNAMELLRDKAVADPALKRIREMMARQLTQLVRLVDDLLDVSRISRGRFELRRAPVSLSLAVKNALESCQGMLNAHGHELAVTLPSEPLWVDGDFARLAQVFTNLLSNSAKYTEPGGRIEVTVQRQDAEAVVSVRDNGIGIPLESLERVFDMFSQLPTHETHAGGGLGIGLALVRNLVQLHGGRVTAHSEGLGKGSTFTVSLPLMQTGAMPKDGTAKRPLTERALERKHRILVADDNIDAASSLALLLETGGHETRTAIDGRQAVELAESFHPEIIFMDVGMPCIDGLEATRQIRAKPWGQSILIVALTGWGQENDRRQTQQVGMDLHLVKPLDPKGIADVLAQAARAR
jgi:signal transduction histidine kinase/ActR/RegA family two-component response regulator